MPATEFHIAGDSYTAVITSPGGALRELRHKGRDLVVSFGPKGKIPDYRGVLCAPWPNRLADGTYTYAGRAFAAPLNEPTRRSALHGLLAEEVWEVRNVHDGIVTLNCSVQSGPSYPSQLNLKVTYSLTSDGLHDRITAVNTGQAAVPYGVCPHPYLVAGPSSLQSN